MDSNPFLVKKMPAIHFLKPIGFLALKKKPPIPVKRFFMPSRILSLADRSQGHAIS
jgi:hypothetical protein